MLGNILVTISINLAHIQHKRMITVHMQYILRHSHIDFRKL